MADKLIFPIGFDLEGGVREVQKNWKTYQAQMQKTVDRNPLKVKIELFSKDLNVTELKEYIQLSKEAARVNNELAKTRLANARTAEVEARTAGKTAIQHEQQRAATARAEQAELKLANAKQRSGKATREQIAAEKTHLSYTERLIQRLTIVGGLYQVIGFVSNIRSVTAEFELQRVALGAIIKDGYEASKMFEQIKAAAVKSPFEIKDLVSYTKQLAAYKIETEDLFDTTMQLADISAGLGVGMERLVLAYGQIRATGYLRASEVRQLTEAGIPIIEELANKISEMRGEMVSAGDVMQMVSERAISFGMVKEVFDDMTSAGGTFYKMQEQQAETLAGQWSNLKDTLSIMYDEMGRSSFVQGLLQGFIDATKTLANNWQTVRNILLAVGGLYAGFKIHALFIRDFASYHTAVTNAISRYRIAVTNLKAAQKTGNKALIKNAEAMVRQERLMVWAARGTNKLNRAFRTLWATIASNPIAAVLIALTALATIVISIWGNSTRLRKELDRIQTEGSLQTEQEVRNFERLANAVKGSVKGSREYKDALEELKRTYGDLLPQRNEDIEQLLREEEGYNKVTKAIQEKIAMQIKEQQLNAIQSHYGEELSSEERDIQKTLEEYGFSKAEVYRFMDDVRKEIEANELKPLKENFTETYAQLYEEKIIQLLERQKKLSKEAQSAIIGDLVDGFGTLGYEDLEDYISLYKDYYEELEAVNQNMETQIGNTGKLAKAYKELKESINSFTSQYQDNTYEFNEEKRLFALGKYREAIENAATPLKGSYLEGIVSTVDLSKYFQDGFDLEGFEKDFNKLAPEVISHIRTLADSYNDLIPKGIDSLIREEWNKIAKETGVSMDKLQNYFKDSEQSTYDWVNSLQEQIEILKRSLSEATLLGDTELQQSLNNEIKAFEKMLAVFDAFVKKDKPRDTRLSEPNKQIQDITNAYKKFIELRKYMSKEEALGNIATFFPSLGNFEPTYENMVARLEKMRDDVRKKLAKSPKDKTLLDMSRELEKSLADIEFDKLKTDLEQKLGRLADDVAKTKTAKEFYDRILGITGDRELSATFTMSVYGESGDELAERTVRQLEAAFEGIDLSNAINYNNFQVDWKKVADIYEAHQEDMLEANRKTAESLIKNAQKVSAEQIQQWVKELEQVKSYADKRVELARQTAERIREIEQSNIPQEQKVALTEQYRKREEEQASKLQYEAFKDSPAYVEMFNNLDDVSTRMLEHLRDKLQGLQSEWKNLDPTQLKELQSRLNAIDEQLSSRNPFKALANSIKEYYELRKQGSRADAEQALTDALQKQADSYALLEERIRSANSAQEQYDTARARYGEDDERTIVAKDTLEATQDQLKTQQGIVDSTDEAVESAQKLVSAWDKIKAGGRQALAGINEFVQAIGQSATKIHEAFGGFGGDDADAEYFNSMVQGVGDLSSGIANIASGNPVQVIQGIGSAVSGISSLFSAGTIRRANKEIAKQQEILEGLEYAYGRLEDATKDALGSDYVKNYQERMRNLTAQQTAYLKQAEAERSKGKNADKAKIKEYENAARDTADEIKDMYGELSEYFLGMGLTDAARELARSWIEAKKEIGDATKAIEERIAEMIENLVLEAGAVEIAKRVMQPFYDEVERLANDADGLTTDEIITLAKMIPQLSEDMNVGLSNYFETLKASGYDITKTASDLTGISKDIATASEESILGLAAGINTQNFYISQIHANVALITQWVQSGGMATQGVSITDLITLQNQHLSHLPNIAANTAGTLAECRAILAETRRVADNLDRVIKPVGVKTSFTVNTTLN